MPQTILTHEPSTAPQRRAALISALQDMARTHGPQMTLRQFCKAQGISPTKIYGNFTSWNELRHAAGLTPQARRAARKSAVADRRNELIRAVREMAQTAGTNLTLRQFTQTLGIPVSQVYWDFASWRELRAAAGLPRSINRSAAASIHTRDSLLAELRRVVADTGPEVSLAEFSRLTGISSHPIERNFGNWPSMRQAAGLPRDSRRCTMPQSRHGELLELLRSIAGHRPHITKLEFCQEHEIPAEVLNRHGPWTELRRKLHLPIRGSRKRARSYEMNKDIVLHPWELARAMGTDLGSMACSSSLESPG